MIIEHFYKDISGWFDYEHIYKTMVENSTDNAHFVEIGAWLGRSSSFMAVEIHNSGKNIKFDVVDTWEGSIQHKQRNYPQLINNTLYSEFLENIKPVKHIINAIKGLSVEVAKKYEDNSLDFVFIDASHEYEDVRADILAWLPKVKTGGIIGGHDYCDGWAGVKKAVNEIFENRHQIDNINKSVWYVCKS